MAEPLGFEITLPVAFDRAVVLAREALKQEGFGILTEIDLRAAFKEKLGKEHTAMPRPHPGDERSLSAPLLQLDLPQELRKLKGEPDWSAGKRTITLAKLGGLRVVLIALRSGATLEEHLAAGGLTVQVLEGRVRLSAANESRTLSPGGLLALEPGLPHGVQALEDAAFLLTLAQPPAGEHTAPAPGPLRA